MGRYAASGTSDPRMKSVRWLLCIMTFLASIVLASAIFGYAPSTVSASSVPTSSPTVTVKQPLPVLPSPTVIVSPIPVATIAPVVPPKSEPLRLVVKDAGIDIAIGKLPMSAEQVAQRIYEAPEQPAGYWAQFEEAGMVYYDVPGSGMTDATFIVGHSCTADACYTADGTLLDKSAWQFTRLADPSKVKNGTAVSVFTNSGEVCSSVIEVNHVGRYDAAAQDVILQEAAKQRYIVINTCDTISGADNIATLVVSKVHPCGV